MTPKFDFDLDQHSLVVAPSAHLEARETSAMAALAAQPFRGSQCATLLKLIEAAGEAGMSDPEIARALGWPRATICIRRHDLRAFLIPATRRAKSEHGRWCVCWRKKTIAEMESGE
jgi:hypothetical protein